MKFSMKRYKKVNVLIQKSECFSENNNTRDKNSVPNRYVFQKDWHSPVFEFKVFQFEMSNIIIPVGVADNAAVQNIQRTSIRKNTNINHLVQFFFKKGSLKKGNKKIKFWGKYLSLPCIYKQN